MESSTNKDLNGQCDAHCKAVHFNRLKKWSAVPKINEWEQLWCIWDVVTTNMINHDTMLLERPIGLRHPFIFYIGHIPTFLDIMITRHKVDSLVSHQQTEHAKFAEIFERGIDPDMDDPKRCNPHSSVPNDENGWPSVKSILQYQQLVRNRLKHLLMSWETENSAISAENFTPSRQSACHVIWMCFEHEAMHLETILYMVVQSPNFKHPPMSPPSWYKRSGKYRKEKLSILHTADMIYFEGGNVEIGLDEPDSSVPISTINFGWDNEHPQRMASVLPFELQSRPVTNGEYWLFWKNTGRDSSFFPASWHFENIYDHLPKVKTSFGLCDFHSALNWPVQVSGQQAEEYASKNAMRLPTEPELIHFRRAMHVQPATKDQKQSGTNCCNYGFKSWTPQSLNNEHIHVLGDVWEWTSTAFNFYEGFIPSQFYPGYSTDFFDGKHRIVLGASWATHPRIAERMSFRNWYQWRYPFVFCGFRLCRSVEVYKSNSV